MRNFNLTDTNTFYAPAGDECWIRLAQEIMHGYASSYCNQLPTDARTQNEYDFNNKTTYGPQRRSILRRVKHGPLRSIVDIRSVYHGFEQRRLANKQFWGIRWVDNYEIDLDNL